MPIADKLKHYLDRKRIVYDVRELAPHDPPLTAAAAAGIAPASIVTTAVLKDELGLVMVAMPATHALDHDALSRLLHRRLLPATEAQLAAVFGVSEPQSLPPFADIYKLRTIVDEALMACEDLYVYAGDASTLIRLANKDFFMLLSQAWLAGQFTRPRADIAAAGADLRRRIESIRELPAMPEMARQLAALRADPAADADRLARLVETDPSLAAQVVRYARSPFFGYRGQVDSVQVAVSRVLGFEMVLNLALGIAAARPFKMPTLGPLGLNAFWRHATYSAALVQALGRELAPPARPPAGLCYLAGLLHNFGHLLLGHLFKREFCALNAAVGERPDVPVVTQELTMLGIDHGEFGAWLMEAWNMPPEVIVAVREHHNEHYDGPHAVYARLVLLVDRMLKEHGLGDAPSHELPADVLNALGLDEVRAVMVVGRILQDCEGLNAAARSLSAA